MAAPEGISIELIGARELDRILRRIAAKDAKAALRKGSRAGAKIITAKAKTLAPVRKEGKGGTLRRAIRTRSAKRSRRYVGAVSTIGKGFFKSETFYGAFIEFGRHLGKRRGGKRTRGQTGGGRRFIEGIHFMERAAKEAGPRAGRIAVATTKRELERLARKAVA